MTIDHDTGSFLLGVALVLMCFLAVRRFELASPEKEGKPRTQGGSDRNRRRAGADPAAMLPRIARRCEKLGGAFASNELPSKLVNSPVSPCCGPSARLNSDLIKTHPENEKNTEA